MPQALAVKNAVPLRDLYQEIEAELFERIVKALRLNNWNEDFLSRSFCEILQERSPFAFVTYDDVVAEVAMTFNKQSGRVEEAVGDIGVTVRFTTKAGQTIVGCAFLEAKRRYHDTSTYKEIRWDQLERIEKNAPHGMLLLYDFDDVRFNEDVSGDDRQEDKPNSRAVVVPITLARAMNKRTIELYQSCTPLAHQVCYRYLQGLDLEMVKDPVAFFSSGGLNPSYVLNIMVNHHGVDATPTNTTTAPITPAGGGAFADAVVDYVGGYEPVRAVWKDTDEEDVQQQRPQIQRTFEAGA
jgi:hypothetical protein